MSIDFRDVDSVEVYQGYPGIKIEMNDGFVQGFVNDFNDSKDVGPTKYPKTHRFLIHYKNNEIDTLLTNGVIHQFNGWYKSKVDLIEKYSKH